MKNIFIDRLKIARQNLSQQAAVDKIGIKQQAYARYETGRSTPGMDVLRKMCVVFGVPADWLLGLSHTSLGRVRTVPRTAQPAETDVERFNRLYEGGEAPQKPRKKIYIRR